MIMFPKSGKIREAEVLLQIYPKGRPIGLQLLLLLLVFSFLSGLGGLLFRAPDLGAFNAIVWLLSCVILCSYPVFQYVNLAEPLTFSEVGITKPGIFAIFWDELSGYNILQDERRKGRKLLYVESNKPPFYHMRFYLVPRNLCWADIYFTDEEALQVEDLFASRGVQKILRGGSGYP